MSNKEIVKDITQLTEDILRAQQAMMVNVSHDMRIKAMEMATRIVTQQMQNEALRIIASSLPM